MNQIDLKGRNAIVTGAAQGIGRAIAERLLQSGAQVSFWDADEELLEKTLNHLIGTTIVVVTTAQHLHLLNQVSLILKNKRFKPMITKGDKRIHSPGQILGCNVKNAIKILRNKLVSQSLSASTRKFRCFILSTSCSSCCVFFIAH